MNARSEQLAVVKSRLVIEALQNVLLVLIVFLPQWNQGEPDASVYTLRNVFNVSHAVPCPLSIPPCCVRAACVDLLRG